VTIKQELIEYSNDVLSGKIVAGREIKWACQRFLNDLKKDWEYEWNEEKATRVVAFFSYMKHNKGILTGKNIELTTFQKFLICQVFAWVEKETGRRRFKKAYVQLGRKNGKSQLLSGVGLYMLGFDNEHSAEIYCAATRKDQAKIVFDECRVMVRGSPQLSKRLKVTRDKIEHVKSNSYLRACSRDDQKFGDGYNPHLAIIDSVFVALCGNM
jgi:phage terminase large subunit-like protein